MLIDTTDERQKEVRDNLSMSIRLVSSTALFTEITGNRNFEFFPIFTSLAKVFIQGRANQEIIISSNSCKIAKYNLAIITEA